MIVVQERKKNIALVFKVYYVSNQQILVIKEYIL